MTFQWQLRGSPKAIPERPKAAKRMHKVSPTTAKENSKESLKTTESLTQSNIKSSQNERKPHEQTCQFQRKKKQDCRRSAEKWTTQMLKQLFSFGLNKSPLPDFQQRLSMLIGHSRTLRSIRISLQLRHRRQNYNFLQRYSSSSHTNVNRYKRKHHKA